MDKIVVGIVIAIALLGTAFFVINERIGPGIDQGGDNLRARIIEATSN